MLDALRHGNLERVDLSNSMLLLQYLTPAVMDVGAVVAAVSAAETRIVDYGLERVANLTLEALAVRLVRGVVGVRALRFVGWVGGGGSGVWHPRDASYRSGSPPWRVGGGGSSSGVRLEPAVCCVPE